MELCLNRLRFVNDIKRNTLNILIELLMHHDSKRVCKQVQRIWIQLIEMLPITVFMAQNIDDKRHILIHDENNPFIGEIFDWIIQSIQDTDINQQIPKREQITRPGTAIPRNHNPTDINNTIKKECQCVMLPELLIEIPLQILDTISVEAIKIEKSQKEKTLMIKNDCVLSENMKYYFDKLISTLANEFELLLSNKNNLISSWNQFCLILKILNNLSKANNNFEIIDSQFLGCFGYLSSHLNRNSPSLEMLQACIQIIQYADVARSQRFFNCLIGLACQFRQWIPHSVYDETFIFANKLLTKLIVENDQTCTKTDNNNNNAIVDAKIADWVFCISNVFDKHERIQFSMFKLISITLSKYTVKSNSYYEWVAVLVESIFQIINNNDSKAKQLQLLQTMCRFLLFDNNYTSKNYNILDGIDNEKQNHYIEFASRIFKHSKFCQLKIWKHVTNENNKEKEKKNDKDNNDDKACNVAIEEIIIPTIDLCAQLLECSNDETVKALIDIVGSVSNLFIVQKNNDNKLLPCWTKMTQFFDNALCACINGDLLFHCIKSVDIYLCKFKHALNEFELSFELYCHYTNKFIAPICKQLFQIMQNSPWTRISELCFCVIAKYAMYININEKIDENENVATVKTTTQSPATTSPKKHKNIKGKQRGKGKKNRLSPKNLNTNANDSCQNQSQTTSNDVSVHCTQSKFELEIFEMIKDDLIQISESYDWKLRFYAGKLIFASYYYHCSSCNADTKQYDVFKRQGNSEADKIFNQLLLDYDDRVSVPLINLITVYDNSKDNQAWKKYIETLNYYKEPESLNCELEIESLFEAKSDTESIIHTSSNGMLNSMSIPISNNNNNNNNNRHSNSNNNSVNKRDTSLLLSFDIIDEPNLGTTNDDPDVADVDFVVHEANDPRESGEKEQVQAVASAPTLGTTVHIDNGSDSDENRENSRKPNQIGGVGASDSEDANLGDIDDTEDDDDQEDDDDDDMDNNAQRDRNGGSGTESEEKVEFENEYQQRPHSIPKVAVPRLPLGGLTGNGIPMHSYVALGSGMETARHKKNTQKKASITKQNCQIGPSNRINAPTRLNRPQSASRSGIRSIPASIVDKNNINTETTATTNNNNNGKVVGETKVDSIPSLQNGAFGTKINGNSTLKINNKNPKSNSNENGISSKTNSKNEIQQHPMGLKLNSVEIIQTPIVVENDGSETYRYHPSQANSRMQPRINRLSSEKKSKYLGSNNHNKHNKNEKDKNLNMIIETNDQSDSSPTKRCITPNIGSDGDGTLADDEIEYVEQHSDVVDNNQDDDDDDNDSCSSCSSSHSGSSYDSADSADTGSGSCISGSGSGSRSPSRSRSDSNSNASDSQSDDDNYTSSGANIITQTKVTLNESQLQYNTNQSNSRSEETTTTTTDQISSISDLWDKNKSTTIGTSVNSGSSSGSSASTTGSSSMSMSQSDSDRMIKNQQIRDHIFHNTMKLESQNVLNDTNETSDNQQQTETKPNWQNENRPQVHVPKLNFPASLFPDSSNDTNDTNDATNNEIKRNDNNININDQTNGDATSMIEEKKLQHQESQQVQQLREASRIRVMDEAHKQLSNATAQKNNFLKYDWNDNSTLENIESFLKQFEIPKYQATQSSVGSSLSNFNKHSKNNSNLINNDNNTNQTSMPQMRHNIPKMTFSNQHSIANSSNAIHLTNSTNLKSNSNIKEKQRINLTSFEQSTDFSEYLKRLSNLDLALNKNQNDERQQFNMNDSNTNTNQVMIDKNKNDIPTASAPKPMSSAPIAVPTPKRDPDWWVKYLQDGTANVNSTMNNTMDN